MERSSGLNMLQAELVAAKAQIVRLEEENVLLRHRLNRISSDQSTNATINVEAKIKAFQLEGERDSLLEALQQHKKKYNRLHEAYLDKVKRCKALEEMFKRQKTLTGLVMKSALDQRHTEQQIVQEKRHSAQNQRTQVEQLQSKIVKLQVALDESYDIIDEMDFELESIDFLEMENQRLREELAAIKAERTATNSASAENKEMPEDKPIEPPPPYEDLDSSARRRYRQEVASSECQSCLVPGDADPSTLERVALTHSLLQTIETESNALRRELLRSRWQQTVRKKGEQEKQ
ncbi:uncharacterized protein LOC115625970 [Scaptodrosophila lebanonensis]|uniref:Uncharacterized protein LOC115625970 n=1 Tax=Drosophila lebanonensis TaxID=7225 RepID=A0A6J2TLZ5_DROLE|nr:uncharacterized protein LOC115625970 [Scaptodrosophila lebanonensis]